MHGKCNGLFIAERRTDQSAICAVDPNITVLTMRTVARQYVGRRLWSNGCPRRARRLRLHNHWGGFGRFGVGQSIIRESGRENFVIGSRWKSTTRIGGEKYVHLDFEKVFCIILILDSYLRSRDTCRQRNTTGTIRGMRKRLV